MRAIDRDLYRAEVAYRRSGEPARRYRDFRYRTRMSWSRTRRVVGKAQHLPRGRTPKFVVTSLSPRRADAKYLYEELYCARGKMENRIKEQQPGLFANRTGSATLNANQLRLFFAFFAYVLMHGFQRLGLTGTTCVRGQCETSRLKLLKISARVRVTVRKVWLSISAVNIRGLALGVIVSCQQRRLPPQ